MSTENVSTEENGNVVLADGKPSIIKKGFVQCIDGETIWVNTGNDELVTILIKNNETRWQLYCKHVKITIEVIDESELE